jgi:PAS domain S-box-containing protein
MTMSQQHEYDLERANESVMTRTIEGRIDFWNRSAENLYGWRKEEAIGRISHELLQTQFPQPLPEIDSELVRNGQWEGKLVHTTRNGGQVVVQSRWTLGLAGQPAAVVEINARPSDYETHPDARTHGYRVEIGRQAPLPTSKLAKADSLLPKFANIILTGGAVFCLLILSYLVYRYSWTGESQLVGWSGMVLYYAVPGILAMLFFASLTLRPMYRLNLAILCLSLGLAVYGMEIFLHLMDPTLGSNKPIWALDGASQERKQKAADYLKQQFGVAFDIRDRIEVIADLQKHGIAAVPAVIPRWLLKKPKNGSMSLDDVSDGTTDIAPLGGVADKVTVLCNESGAYVTYHSDERGFHNPKGIWQSAGAEIAAVGDSFVQGYCVPSEKNFVALIRNHHPATLNLGMAGEAPLLMLATMQEYLPRFRPKIVLWFYYEGNDLVDLLDEQQSPLLMRYLKNDFSQGLVARQGEVDQVLTDYIAKEKAKKLSQGPKAPRRLDALLRIVKLNSLRQRLGLIHGEDAEDANALAVADGDANIKLLRDILSQAKSRVSGWDGTLYFVYLPAWERYARNNRGFGTDARTTVLTLVKGLDIPIIDIHPAIQADGDPLSLFPFRVHGHYNEKGHEIVAGEVLKAISSVSSGLIRERQSNR